MSDERASIGRPRTVSDDDIIAAAVRAVEQNGPARLTLAHVAGEVGLAPATLLQRFGSKHGLLVAIAERAPAEVTATFAAARANGTSAELALLSALIDPWAGIDSPAALANHLAFLQLDLTDPELRQHASDHSVVMRSEIRRSLDAAIEEGTFVVEQDEQVELLVEMIMATVSGSLVTWALNGDGTVEDWLRQRLNFLLTCFRHPDSV